MTPKNSDVLICFDLDGVLIKSGQAVEDIYLGVMKSELNLEPPQMIDPQVWSLTPEARFEALWGEEVCNEEAVKKAHALYRQHKTQGGCMLCPQVKETLEWVSEAFENVFITSNNSSEVSREIAERMGILHYFKKVLGADHVLYPKPAPDLYQKAAELAYAEPGKMLVFEDSITGVHAAKAAGAKVIGLATGYGSFKELSDLQPNLVLNDLSELNMEKIKSLLEI